MCLNEWVSLDWGEGTRKTCGVRNACEPENTLIKYSVVSY
jgi:hypothetical protein